MSKRKRVRVTAAAVELFDSTVALTAYNWLAVYRGGPATGREIERGVRQHYASSPAVMIPDGQVQRCLARLEARGLVRRVPGVRGDDFDVTDARRRPATRRRAVVVANDPESGWQGWSFFPREAALASALVLEPVADEPAAR